MQRDDSKENAEINKTSSERKKAFMQAPYPNPMSLTMAKMMEISSYYKKKYGIDLTINFKSECMNKILKEFQQSRKLAVANRINAIQNQENIDCVEWLLKNEAFDILTAGCEKGDDLAKYLLKKPDLDVENDQAVIESFFNNFDFKEYLSNLPTEDKVKVNSLLKKLRNVSYFIAYMETPIFCYDASAISKEIRAIQDSLKKNQAVGYIYTSHQLHVEVLIITEKGAYKPVSWWAANINTFQSISITHAKDIQGNYFDSDFSNFILVNNKEGKNLPTPHPQATVRGCDALGIICLKELLKEDAQQFHQDTLSFTSCSKEGERHFIFPSPQTLRYSQSLTFNVMVKEMLIQDKTVTISYKDNFYTITPIRVIFEESLKFLKSNQPASPLIEQIEKQLIELPDFQKRWLKEYEKQSIQRMTMQSNGINLFHAYKSYSLSTQTMESLTFRLEQKQLANSDKREHAKNAIGSETPMNLTDTVVVNVDQNQTNVISSSGINSIPKCSNEQAISNEPINTLKNNYNRK